MPKVRRKCMQYFRAIVLLVFSLMFLCITSISHADLEKMDSESASKIRAQGLGSNITEAASQIDNSTIDRSISVLDQFQTRLDRMYSLPSNNLNTERNQSLHKTKNRLNSVKETAKAAKSFKQVYEKIDPLVSQLPFGTIAEEASLNAGPLF